ncbi:DHA2 family efflux MFS transporter permease subunit [Actinomadura darangshiensis]|uniref:DHA2 family efflux MFS transporter permease subunit n=1 Tax=Actinomadura darangshiensis TaxID=705336 RepID=A0A4R5C0A9_9ACTN|nr:MDR family MFS transporter [Actinomadura darangshiensis]TDD91423.1 DHA2 family efflux MFS transporter permease subunit [Actinomadura darangshiensis]
MKTSTTGTTQAVGGRLPARLVTLMITVALGSIMMQMDATMTNIAYNTLLKEFDTSLLTIQWITTGYLLAMAAVMALCGWALDRFGARTMWITSIAVFLLGSVLCGIAWDAPALIAFRLVQGLGGGMVLPLGMAILAQEAGPSRLGRVMGVMGVPSALGPVLGPVLGGVIVDDWNWRWIFFINVPVCVAAVVLAWRTMPTRRSPNAGRLDVLGLLLLSPGCAVVVFALTEAGRYGSFADRHVVLPLVIGFALLTAFSVHALRTDAPILDLRLLKVRSFLSSSTVLFFASVALFGAVGVLPLYYQQARGHSVLEAGLLLAPQGLGMAVSLFAVGRLADRAAPRLLVSCGLTLTAAGSIVFTQLGTHTDEVLLSGALVLSGAGIGMVMVPAMAAAIRDIPGAAIPRASAANRIIMQLGSSFGSAVLIIVLQNRINHLIDTKSITPDGLAGAYGHTFWWVLGFAAISIVLTLLMPARPPQQQRSVDATVPIA